MELDRVPLWRGDHVDIKQLVDDFGRYLYLPRLAGPHVLTESIREGLRLFTWQQDSFAFADTFDEMTQRYRGLRAAEHVSISDSDRQGLLVKPDVARKQIDAETAPKETVNVEVDDAGFGPTPPTGTETAGRPSRGVLAEPSKPRRFHGTVDLDPKRVGRDAGQIADEVIAHLEGLVNATVKVTLEIEAEIPEGVPEQVVRTVTENSRTLKFKSHEFESE
jgi:hypothetical protein